MFSKPSINHLRGLKCCLTKAMILRLLVRLPVAMKKYYQKQLTRDLETVENSQPVWIQAIIEYHFYIFMTNKTK